MELPWAMEEVREVHVCLSGGAAAGVKGRETADRVLPRPADRILRD